MVTELSWAVWWDWWSEFSVDSHHSGCQLSSTSQDVFLRMEFMSSTLQFRPSPCCLPLLPSCCSPIWRLCSSTKACYLRSVTCSRWKSSNQHESWHWYMGPKKTMRRRHWIKHVLRLRPQSQWLTQRVKSPWIFVVWILTQTRKFYRILHPDGDFCIQNTGVLRKVDIDGNNSLSTFVYSSKSLTFFH